MPRYVFEGQGYIVPDDWSEEDAIGEINRLTKPAEWRDVRAQMIPDVRRTLADAMAGGQAALGKVVGSEGMVEEGLATQKYIEEERQTDLPKNMSMVQEAAISVPSSLALAAPAAVVGGVAAPLLGARVAAGLLTKEAARGALLGGVTTGFAIPTGLSKFGETLRFGHTTERATVHGLIHGLFEKYTEYLPLKEMVKGGLRNFLKAMGHEIVGEEIATIGQAINDRLSTKPDATLADLGHDMAVTAIATAMAGPIQAGTVRATVAAMAPFIKPEELTAEQKAVVDRAVIAATSDGAPMPPLPQAVLGAVTPQTQTRAVDLADMVLPDKHPAPKEGTQRVYTVLPNEGVTPELVTWTPNIEAVQQVIDSTGPNVRIPYVDMTPEELTASQTSEATKKIRTEQAVGEGDFVLPSSFATAGQYLYGEVPAQAPPTEVPPPAPLKVSASDRTLQLPRAEGPRLKVKFEDPASKQLYLYAKHNDEGSTFMAQETLATERAALAQTYGVPEDQVLPMARFYRTRVDEVTLNIKGESVEMKKFTVDAFTQEQVKEQSPEGVTRKQARDNGQKGQVYFSPDYKPTATGRKAQAFLQKWLTMFAPDTKLMILRETQGEEAARYLPGGNAGSIVIPDESRWGPVAVFILAHEFGHHLFSTRMLRSEHAAALAEMKLEHAALVAKVPEMTVEEFIRVWMPAGRTFLRRSLVRQLFQIPEGKQYEGEVAAALQMPALTLVQAIDAQRFDGYALSFDEYAAEQFARYIGVKHETTLSGEVKQFFDDAMYLLRHFFYSQVQRIRPQEKFEQWIDYLTIHPPSVEGALEDAINMRVTTMFMETVDTQRAWTLKTLEALPKRDKILRKTILELIERNIPTRTFVDDFGDKLTAKYPLVTDDLGNAVVVKEQRQELTGQEYRVLKRALATFDGDVIDRAAFFAKVEEDIIPLTTENHPYPFAPRGLELAGYGLSRIGQLIESGVYESFYLPFTLDQRSHETDQRYMAHARWFDALFPGVAVSIRSIVELQSDLFQRLKERTSTGADVTSLGLSLLYAKQELAGVKRYLAASRAVVDHGDAGLPKFETTIDREMILAGRLLANDRRALAGLPPIYELASHFVLSDSDVEWGFRYTNTYDPVLAISSDIRRRGVEMGLLRPAVSRIDRETLSGLHEPVGLEGWRFVRDALVDMVETRTLKVQEAEIELYNAQQVARGEDPSSRVVQFVPGRWWEIMLRKLNAEASRDGVVKMRMATADTVAKVEGWPQIERIEVLKNLNLVYEDEEWGKVQVIGAQPDAHDPNDYVVIVRDEKGEIHEPPAGSVPESIAEVMRTLPRIITYGRNQGIYNRYAKEITNFVKREFGAKEVAENPIGGRFETPPRLSGPFIASEGNTWLEWDVKPNLDGVPVQYYDIATSGLNASENLEAAVADAMKDELAGSVPTWFKRSQGFLMLALKLSQLARKLPHVEPVQAYRRRMQEMANKKSSVMAFVNDRIKQWYGLSQKNSRSVMEMLELEVRGEVHWTKLVKHQVIGPKGQPMELWLHEMTPQVMEEATKRGMSPEAVQLFLDVKNDYLTILGMQEETLMRSIEHTFRNNLSVAAGRKAVTMKIFENLRQRPYVPDRRFGQWSVIVKATKDTKRPDGVVVKSGEKVWFSRHESESDQKVAFSQLRKEWGSDFKVSRDYMPDVQYSLRGLPREFVTSLPEALELTPEQVEKFQELSFDLTREGKYLAMFMKKKSRVAGMEQDMRRSYADHMWRSSNAIAKMEFGWQLRGEMRKLSNLANKVDNAGGDPVPLRRVYEYLTKNYEYVMEPQHEWEQIRAVTALWYLWGVPKTALMNGTTMITTTYPRLAAQYGDGKAVKEIVRAMRDVAFFWQHPEKVGTEEAAILHRAKADGTTNQSFAAEAAAVADGNAVEKVLPEYSFLKNAQMKDRARTSTWKLLHWGMTPFRVMEEFNRRATLLAAYRLGKAAGLPDVHTSIEEGSAYLAAKDTVDYTQNEYAPWDRAPFLRGKKSVALIFFSFMQHMSFFMFGGDKGWWRGLLMLWALGGLVGLPGAQNILDFANWLGRKMFDEPVDLQLEARAMIRAVGMNPDWVLHGSMHSMFGLGWDAASSVGMGRIIPGTDAIFGQGDASRRVLQMSGEIFGPFGGMTVNVLQALMDDNPNSLVRFERAAPTFARNLSRGVRAMSEDRWTDARGRTLIDETTGLEVLGQLLGAQPQRKSLMQEQRHAQNEAAQFYALRRQNLLTGLWQATEIEDSEAIGAARAKIGSYNAQVPDPQLRITAQEIQQSTRAHRRAQRQLETGAATARRYRPLYERVGSTFTQ